MEQITTDTPDKYIVGIKIYIPGIPEILKSTLDLTAEQLQAAEVTFSGSAADTPAGHDGQELYLSTTKLKFLLGQPMSRKHTEE